VVFRVSSLVVSILALLFTAPGTIAQPIAKVGNAEIWQIGEGKCINRGMSFEVRVTEPLDFFDRDLMRSVVSVVPAAANNSCLKYARTLTFVGTYKEYYLHSLTVRKRNDSFVIPDTDPYFGVVNAISARGGTYIESSPRDRRDPDFPLSPPTNLSCVSAPFERACRKGGGVSINNIRYSEISSTISEQTYLFYQFTEDMISEDLSPPDQYSQQKYKDRYRLVEDEQFSLPTAIVSIDGRSVSIKTTEDEAVSNIRLIPAGNDQQNMPGYECFEAAPIASGCVFIVNSDARTKEKLFLARPAIRKTNLYGEQWRTSLLGFLKKVSNAEAEAALGLTSSAQGSEALANATAVRDAKPKPFMDFEMVSADWREFWREIYYKENDSPRDFKGSLAYKFLFYNFQTSLSRVCPAYARKDGIAYDFEDYRVVDWDRGTDFSGAEKLTIYKEEYVRETVFIRSHVYEQWKRIAETLNGRIIKDWFDNPGDDYVLYFSRLNNWNEVMKADAEAFLQQESCSSPTINRFEDHLGEYALAFE